MHKLFCSNSSQQNALKKPAAHFPQISYMLSRYIKCSHIDTPVTYSSSYCIQVMVMCQIPQHDDSYDWLIDGSIKLAERIDISVLTF